MYAAAGGASIASRKARQNKALAKGVAAAAKKAAPPKPKQLPKVNEKPRSKQFHHLPDNYYRHAECSSTLAPPPNSLNHSRSLTLKPEDEDGPGMRPSHSAQHFPPSDQTSVHVGSPPRPYTCNHWESKLQKPVPPSTFGSTENHHQPHSVCECAQGKAAWQEAAAHAATREAAVSGHAIVYPAIRRCSVSAEGGNYRSRQNEAHLRWIKRNRIHDLSYGGSSSDDEEAARIRAANAAGNLLYIGLGTVALGLVISFVGTGDKGFKTLELRLAGPALIVAGLACCLVRIILCAIPARCFTKSRSRHRSKEPAAERLLLTERPHPPRRLSITATAVMLQHEKETALPSTCSARNDETPVTTDKDSTPITQQPRQTLKSPPPPGPGTHVIPLLLLSQPPKHSEDSLIELQAMDGSSLDISSISSGEISVDNLTVIETAIEQTSKVTKLNKMREAVNYSRPLGMTRTVTFADTPNIIAPPSEAPPPPAEIVLTPSKLAQ